jgi:hypothetical protein
MSPQKLIFIIRHGEKPEQGSSAPGFDEMGTLNAKGLTIRGWQRAGAWAALFGLNLNDYPVPKSIYAANPERRADGTIPSRRSYLTALPLSARLTQAVETKWAEGEEAGLVAEVMETSGVTLIAWEHKRITDGLLSNFFSHAGQSRLLTKWDAARYDVMLRLDFSDHGLTMRQVFPCLLSRDSDQPMWCE